MTNNSSDEVRLKIGWRVVEAAMLFGVCANVLWRTADGLGINVALGIGVLLGGLRLAAHHIGKARSVAPTVDTEASRQVEDTSSQRLSGLSFDARRWLMPAVMLFALCVAWRDSGVLKALDVTAIFVLLSLVILESQPLLSVRVAGVTQYAKSCLETLFALWFGGFSLLLKDVAWIKALQQRQPAWSRHLGAVLRGVVIVVPLALLFGVLLVAADEVFSRLIKDVFNIDLTTFAAHALFIGLMTWLAAGFMREVFVRDLRAAAVIAATTSTALPNATLISSLSKNDSLNATTTTAAEVNQTALQASKAKSFASNSFCLGAIEASLILGVLNLLFAAFVAVQIRYLFGGVEASGLSVTEYARRGFFELVWVALLVLTMLLVAHYLLEAKNVLAQKIFRVLAGAMVGLVFVIMCSAIQRMRLYQVSYGLTELRVYTMAFMVWLGVMLAWFSWTVLIKDARQSFAIGALTSGLCAILALHVVNPDALIVRSNIARTVNHVADFDYNYALDNLSLDATPEILYALPAFSDAPAQHAAIVNRMQTQHERLQNADWRGWSISRHTAYKLLKQNEGD